MDMMMMNVNQTRAKKTRAPKVKVISVDTRKPDAAKLLAFYTPERGFAEIISSRRSDLRKTPVFRYFHKVGEPTVPANNYGNMSVNDSLDDLIDKMAHVGVTSQNEFDELADLFERKAAIGVNSRKSRKNRKSRNSRKVNKRKSTRKF